MSIDDDEQLFVQPNDKSDGFFFAHGRRNGFSVSISLTTAAAAN